MARPYKVIPVKRLSSCLPCVVRLAHVAAILPVALGAAGGCAPRFDLNLTWTIVREDPATACGELADGHVQITLNERDTSDGLGVEEVVAPDSDCTAAGPDRAILIRTAAFSTVSLALLDGEDVVGHSAPEEFAPAGGDVRGTPEAPLGFDIAIERSTLVADFTVVGEDCATAGVASFSVTVQRSQGPLSFETIVDNQAVACTGGDAQLTLADLHTGERYVVTATAPVGDATYVGTSTVDPVALSTHTTVDVTAP